jgi:hypothetical protein
MIGATLALLAGGVSVFPDGDISAAQLPDLFVAACLDGKATLSMGGAAAVGLDRLPRELTQKLGKPSSAQVWRLSSDGRAYLYILNYKPARNTNPRICGIASDAMDYQAAADVVEKRVTGAVYPRTTQSIQWLDAKGGYNAIATTAGAFKVLQINWLSDQQRKVLARGYQTASH